MCSMDIGMHHEHKSNPNKWEVQYYKPEHGDKTILDNDTCPLCGTSPTAVKKGENQNSTGLCLRCGYNFTPNKNKRLLFLFFLLSISGNLNRRLCKAVVIEARLIIHRFCKDFRCMEISFQ